MHFESFSTLLTCLAYLIFLRSAIMLCMSDLVTSKNSSGKSSAKNHPGSKQRQRVNQTKWNKKRDDCTDAWVYGKQTGWENKNFPLTWLSVHGFGYFRAENNHLTVAWLILFGVNISQLISVQALSGCVSGEL